MSIYSKLTICALGLGLVLNQPAWGGNLASLKMAKRFGVGIEAGGPLAILGIEADANITEEFSLGLGIGTGLDYSTFMFRGRYFLLGDWVSPYIGCSVARWWTGGTSATSISPSLLANSFLGGGYNYAQGFSVWVLAPAIGVQFMHSMGFAISVELEYMFRLVNFSNGVYGGLSALWYF